MRYKIWTTALIAGSFMMIQGCTSSSGKKETAAFPDRQEILCRVKKYPLKPMFPAASDRKAWGGLSDDLRRDLISTAETALKKPWKKLTAKDYMLFRRKGDRNAYQEPFFYNRALLMDLVCGECCEYKGRFIDGIIEGLWQILSEPVWCVPAHENLPIGELLPDPRRFKIDLTSAETGKILCDVLSLLEKELAAVSPALVRRVKMEVIRRVIEPSELLNDENTWWFSGRNNWTPWCSYSIASCAVYLLNDQPERLAKILDTYLGISRRFYDRYPDDGGCNEGPTYWRHAPGKYIQLLAMIDNRLQLQGRLFKDEKLRRMCDYLPGMNLCGLWFLSTNDASPHASFSPNFLNYAAKKVQSKELAGLAARLPLPKKISRLTDLEGRLSEIFFAPAAGETAESGFKAVNFWPQLNIAILRADPEAPEKSTVIALKGGHNAESHNHLDLGHFSVFSRNKPFIVDIGSGVYTATTFSEKRYTLWNLNETGHNAPRFSGRGQIADFKKSTMEEARYKAFLTLENDSTVSTVLDNAYPEEVGVKSLKRTVVLDRRNGDVSVRDTAEVEGEKIIDINLYTAVEPETFDAGTVKWKKGILTVKGLSVKKVVQEDRMDKTLKKNWGRLWRIELSGVIRESGSWRFDFNFSR